MPFREVMYCGNRLLAIGNWAEERTKLSVDSVAVARALMPRFGAAARLGFQKSRTGFRWRQLADDGTTKSVSDKGVATKAGG